MTFNHYITSELFPITCQPPCGRSNKYAHFRGIFEERIARRAYLRTIGPMRRSPSATSIPQKCPLSVQSLRRGRWGRNVALSRTAEDISATGEKEKGVVPLLAAKIRSSLRGSTCPLPTDRIYSDDFMGRFCTCRTNPLKLQFLSPSFL